MSRDWGQARCGQANTTTAVSSIEGSNGSTIPSLFHKQFQKLLTLLNWSSEGSDKFSGKVFETFTCIIDSQVSNHVTGKKDLPEMELFIYLMGLRQWQQWLVALL